MCILKDLACLIGPYIMINIWIPWLPEGRMWTEEKQVKWACTSVLQQFSNRNQPGWWRWDRYFIKLTSVRKCGRTEFVTCLPPLSVERIYCLASTLAIAATNDMKKILKLGKMLRVKRLRFPRMLCIYKISTAFCQNLKENVFSILIF